MISKEKMKRTCPNVRELGGYIVGYGTASGPTVPATSMSITHTGVKTTDYILGNFTTASATSGCVVETLKCSTDGTITLTATADITSAARFFYIIYRPF